GNADRLAAVVVHHVIPSVHHLRAHGEMRTYGNRTPQAEVVVRNRQCKQQRSRVVPVGVTLDNFGAGAGDELTEIQGQTLGLAGLPGDVCLLDILAEATTDTLNQIQVKRVGNV